MSLVSVKRRTIAVMQDQRGGYVTQSAPLTENELFHLRANLMHVDDWKLLYLVRCRPRGAPRFKDAFNLPDRLT